jgi:DNA gyrase subunit B
VRVSDVERVRPLAPEEGTGTTVRWRSDDTIFDAGAHLAPATLAARLREKAYLVRGLEFRLRLPGHDEQVFRSERGLADYVRELNEEREAVHPNVVSLYAPQADVPTEVALGWTTSSEERVYSFCNVVNTVDGGTHVSGLRRALTRCLNLYAWETGRLKRDRGESLEPKDVFEGLTAALSVMLENPQFEGQTKGRLNNGDAQAAVQAVTQSAFTEWLAAKEHAAEARAILERCLLGREIRLAKGRISKKLRNAATSIFSDSNLPGKLADTLDNPAVAIDDRELFVVEGDSAGGCFVGETEVRLASGRHRSMRALAEDWERGVTHFGYATNAVGDVRVVPLVAPRVTRRAARLVEVALDNGQTVRCTPDHRFRLRDGSYAAAEALRPGTSLMPLKVSHTDERAAIGPGYELVWMNGRGAWWHTHHLADLFNLVTGVQRPSAGPVRHHVDFDKRNNDPRNLVRIGQSEHLMLHAALASAQLRRLWQDPAYRARKTAQARTTARRQWQDPTYRETMCARLRELRSDPVYTRRILDGFQRWWADRTPAERSAYDDRMRRYQEEFWAVDAHRPSRRIERARSTSSTPRRASDAAPTPSRSGEVPISAAGVPRRRAGNGPTTRSGPGPSRSVGSGGSTIRSTEP